MEQKQKRRQVPIWLPLAIFGLILIALTVLFIGNPTSLVLASVFPMGLTMFFAQSFGLAGSKTGMALGGPLMVLPYALYVILFAGILLARRWITFGIVWAILIFIFLLNLAGCRAITQGLSNIH